MRAYRRRAATRLAGLTCAVMRTGRRVVRVEGRDVTCDVEQCVPCAYLGPARVPHDPVSGVEVVGQVEDGKFLWWIHAPVRVSRLLHALEHRGRVWRGGDLYAMTHADRLRHDDLWAMMRILLGDTRTIVAQHRSCRHRMVRNGRRHKYASRARGYDLEHSIGEFVAVLSEFVHERGRLILPVGPS